MVYNDWFLPSRNELLAIYDELRVYGIGNFIFLQYWTSSQRIDAGGLAYSLDFTDRTEGETTPNGLLHVRACRSFTSVSPSYSLRDVGPAGGWIFYKSGDDYLEAAPMDLADEVFSNLSTVNVGAQGTAIGIGQVNTTAIISAVGHINSAAKLCDDLSITFPIIAVSTTAGPTTTIPSTTGSPSSLFRGVTISHKLPDRITSTDLVPHVIFSISPGLGGCYEFLDMFINSTYKPSSVVLSLNRDLSDPSIVLGSKITTYNPGWFYIHGFPKTIGKKVLIGKTLYVKVLFDNKDLFYDLRQIKTGFRATLGG